MSGANNQAIGQLTAAASRFIDWGYSLNDFSSSLAIKVPERVGLAEVRRAVAALSDCHEMLRTRYEFAPDPKCIIGHLIGDDAEDERLDVRRVDATGISSTAADELVRSQVEVSRGRLNPVCGNVISCALITGAPDKNLLLLTIHHLVLDGVSWRIIVEDLDRIFTQQELGGPISLAPEVTTCSEWVDSLRKLSGQRENEAEYWLRILRTPHTTHTTQSVSPIRANGLIIGETAERIIQQLPFEFGAPPSDVLLAAYGLALFHLTGRPNAILVQGHGRYAHLFPEADLTRTVGWIADDYPVCIGATGELREQMKSTVEGLPESPEDYTLLRSYSVTVRDLFDNLTLPQYYFSFHGDIRSASDSMLSNVGALREWQIGNLDIFSLSLQIWIISAGDEAAIEYSFYSPPGVIDRTIVDEIARRWKEILSAL